MKNLIYRMGLLLFAISPLWIHAQDADQSLQVQSTLDQQMAQVPQALQTDDTKPGLSRFLLRGYAHSGLEVTDEEFTFVGGSFNPILVFRQSDRLLFESELEFEFEDGELEIGLEYADMSYILTKGLTLRVGNFLTPFGKFIPDLHPAWINKFPTMPLGAGHHGGILPTDDIGAELRGGAYLGNMKTNYSFYIVNGPQLNDGTLDPEEGGDVTIWCFPRQQQAKIIWYPHRYIPVQQFFTGTRILRTNREGWCQRNQVRRRGSDFVRYRYVFREKCNRPQFCG